MILGGKETDLPKLNENERPEDFLKKTLRFDQDLLSPTS